jgi:hypothetical protein
MKEIVAGDFLREHEVMDSGAVKVKVYGLRLTRTRYILIQVFCFAWMLVLYGLWRHAKIEVSSSVFARKFDFLLLAVYIYGGVETIIVLRRFKKAGAAPEQKKTPDSKTTDNPRGV